VQAVTSAEPLNITGIGVAGNGALITSTGSGTYGGPVTLAGNTSVGGAGSLTVGGVITDGASSFLLTKVGAGSTTLSAANTYDGGTSISTGVLNVTNVAGSATGTGAVAVAAGATLSGSGIITGTVTTASTGHIPPAARSAR